MIHVVHGGVTLHCQNVIIHVVHGNVMIHVVHGGVTIVHLVHGNVTKDKTQWPCCIFAVAGDLLSGS